MHRLTRSWELPRGGYGDGLRTLGSSIYRILVFIFPEADENTKFSFPEFLLLDTFLKVGFFTFVIPFRISKNKEGRYKVVSNIVQQSISTLLVFGAAVYSILSMRILFKEDLKKKPGEAFAVIYGMIKHCYPIAWFYTFWIRRNSFRKFLSVCQSNSSSPAVLLARMAAGATPFFSPSGKLDDQNLIPKPKYSVGWILTLLCRISVLTGGAKIFLETYQFYARANTTETFLGNALSSNAETALYSYFISNEHPRDDLKNMSLVNLTEELKLFNLTCSCSSVLFGYFHDHIGNMLEAFCFIGAAIIFSICDRYVHVIPKIKDGEDETKINPIFLEGTDSPDGQPKRLLVVLDKMSVDYNELNKAERAANDMFGSLILFYILGSFPSLAGLMMFKQKSSIVGLNFRYFSVIYSVAMHVLLSMTASEGHYKMSEYKCWLFEVSLLRRKCTPQETREGLKGNQPVIRSNSALSRLNHLHREVASDTIGLKGCGFFTITHSLIGTMLGIFVTFAIVIIQFEMDSDNKGSTV